MPKQTKTHLTKPSSNERLPSGVVRRLSSKVSIQGFNKSQKLPLTNPLDHSKSTVYVLCHATIQVLCNANSCHPLSLIKVKTLHAGDWDLLCFSIPRRKQDEFKILRCSCSSTESALFYSIIKSQQPSQTRIYLFVVGRNTRYVKVPRKKKL